MIIYSENFIEIVGILAKSDINVDDCKKITYFIVDVFHENQELKKQLEEKENQQKEFIGWLEREIKTVEGKIIKYDELLMNGKETDIDYYESMINKGMSDACKEILEKYKEIIGSK